MNLDLLNKFTLLNSFRPLLQVCKGPPDLEHYADGGSHLDGSKLEDLRRDVLRDALFIVVSSTPPVGRLSGELLVRGFPASRAPRRLQDAGPEVS